MGAETTRRRALPSLSGRSWHVSENKNAPWYPWETDAPPFGVAYRDVQLPKGKQVTVSEGHPFHSSKRKGVVTGDVGGPFFTQKSYVLSKHKVKSIVNEFVYDNNPERRRRYTHTGLLVANPNPTSSSSDIYPPSYATSDDDLDEMGASAIANCAPTNSPANASTFLGELMKDGLPSLIGSQFWKDRTSKAKSASGEYLNIQFGWRPLVNDVSKFADVVRHADTVLAQFERDSGRVVRRKYKFPDEVSTESVQIAYDGQATPFGVYATVLGPGQTWGPVVRTRKITKRRYFSGAFTYFLPSGYDSRNEMSRFALLAERLGAVPTPDVLWELAPWSWAIDWFSNAGDVVSNISNYAKYGLIMRYGYIMEHVIVQDTYTQEGNNPFKVDPLILVTETKRRRQANPYGFGVSWDGLSSFQASILAALGINRSRR